MFLAGGARSPDMRDLVSAVAEHPINRSGFTGKKIDTTASIMPGTSGLLLFWHACNPEDECNGVSIIKLPVRS